jgi:hypothetical protein
MDNEIESITTLDVYDSLPIPKYQKYITVKWVYKLKKDKEGNILNYKAQVVVMGFFQREVKRVNSLTCSQVKKARKRFRETNRS